VNSVRLEDLACHRSFRRLATIDGVVIDLRYASTDNFAGRVLYDGIDCAWLRVEAAAGLEAARDALARVQPRLRLVLLDGLRPHRVQQAIWQDVRGTPVEAYFADPALGSIHSFGLAVDVTLHDADGRALDMGSGYDEASERSHPALEAQQLRAGAITPAHVAARDTLRAAMAAGGFGGIATEWWHFNLGEPARIRRDEPRVD
jgi:D-alanyl-D-alanine dipeptidase